METPLHATLEVEEIHFQKLQAWLYTGSLFQETEGFMTDIYDQVVPTNMYRKKMLTETVPTTKCRMCVTNIAKPAILLWPMIDS